MTEEEHQADAEAKLIAAESEVGSWMENPTRPTIDDLIALRRLLRRIRLHVHVVESS